MKSFGRTFVITLMLILLFTGCAKEEPVLKNEDLFESETSDTVISEPENTAADFAVDELGDDDIPEANDIPEAEAGNADENDVKKDGFVFTSNGVDIYMGEDVEKVTGELGTEKEYYESDSCSSVGIMKTYIYNGFEITTYMKDENDYHHVYSVTLIDDSVSTVEGLYIGATLEDMLTAYGTEYEGITGVYRYTKNGTVLSFFLDNDIINSIVYCVSAIY